MVLTSTRFTHLVTHVSPGGCCHYQHVTKGTKGSKAKAQQATIAIHGHQELSQGSTRRKTLPDAERMTVSA